MGSMSKLIGLLPGAGGMKKQLDNFDESELVRTRAIIESMTPQERNDPKVLNGSRRARIAKGSGRAISEINSLVERFSQAQKVMKQMRNGSLPAGMAPIGGLGSIPPIPPLFPTQIVPLHFAPAVRLRGRTQNPRILGFLK